MRTLSVEMQPKIPHMRVSYDPDRLFVLLKETVACAPASDTHPVLMGSTLIVKSFWNAPVFSREHQGHFTFHDPRDSAFYFLASMSNINP